MKVNLFKLSNSKSQHPLTKPKKAQPTILTINNIQEAHNDPCRPVRIFNSQLASNTPTDNHNKSQLQYTTKRVKGSVMMSNEKPKKYNFKDSMVSSKNNKMSGAFTNADSKSYCGKEINDLCPNAIDNNMTDTTFFSLISTNEEKNHGKMSQCGCSQRRSVGLNTQELIRITNQRKIILNKLEETERKRRNSYDMSVFDQLQTSFDIESNNEQEEEHKEEIIKPKNVVKANKEIVSIILNEKDDNDDDDLINQGESLFLNNKDKNIETFFNKSEGDIEVSISMNRNNIISNKLDDNAFDSMTNFIDITQSNQQLFPQPEHVEFNIENAYRITEDLNDSKLEFKIETNNDILNKDRDTSKLEFKIETRSEVYGKNQTNTTNQIDSFCDNDAMMTINEPFKVSSMTIKDDISEINEIDYDRNRLQNETKLMINFEEEFCQKDFKIHPSIDPLDCLRKYHEPKDYKVKFDYEKYMTKPVTIQPMSTKAIICSNINSQRNCIDDYESDWSTIKKVNYFEETLQKISKREDTVGNYNDIPSQSQYQSWMNDLPNKNQSSTIPQSSYNNRYELKEDHTDIIIPQIDIITLKKSSLKHSKESNTPITTQPNHNINVNPNNQNKQKQKNNEERNQSSQMQIKPSTDNKHSRAQSCGKPRRGNLNNDKKPKNYADLYMKKNTPNDSYNNSNINDKPIAMNKHSNKTHEGNSSNTSHNTSEYSSQRNRKRSSIEKQNTEEGRNANNIKVKYQDYIFDTLEAL